MRVNNLEANVEVQWQVGEDTDASGSVDADEWMDLDGQTGLTLTLTSDHAGKMVRARLTHKGDEDNPSHVTWVDYSASATVTAPPAATNNAPARTQATYEIRENPDMGDDDTEGTATGNVASLFFDADGDDLTYTLVGDPATTNVQPGNMVYRSDNDDQILTLNSKTGAITYYTNNATSHDDDTTDTDGDGGGNIFSVTVNANDGMADTTDDLTVNVRVNVAPTAINLNGTAIQSDAMMAGTDTTWSFAETEDFDATTAGVSAITLDVQDLNLNTDDFGSHTLTVDDDRFEVERVTGTDMSMWTLNIKDGAKFDYEDEDNPDGCHYHQGHGHRQGRQEDGRLPNRRAYRCER